MKYIPKGYIIFHSYPQWMRMSIGPCSLKHNTVVFCILSSSRGAVESRCHFIFSSWRCGAFSYAYPSSVDLLWWGFWWCLVQLFNDQFLSYTWIFEVLQYLASGSFIRYCLLQVFFPFLWLVFSVIEQYFSWTMFLFLINFNLFIVLSLCAFNVATKMSLPHPRLSRFSSMLFLIYIIFI